MLPINPLGSISADIHKGEMNLSEWCLPNHDGSASLLNPKVPRAATSDLCVRVIMGPDSNNAPVYIAVLHLTFC